MADLERQFEHELTAARAEMAGTRARAVKFEAVMEERDRLLTQLESAR